MKSRSTLLRSILAASAIAMLSAPSAQARTLHRLASDFFGFDGNERFTDLTAVADCSSPPCVPGTPDGALLYRKTVKVPKNDNVLFVSVFSTGDAHGGAALWLSCRVDGAFCNPGTGLGDAGSPGWISMLKLPVAKSGSYNCNDGGGGAGDCHDNAFSYQWCIPIEKGKEFLVDLKLATSSQGNTVFLERTHVYVDSAWADRKNRCAEYSLPDRVGGPEVTVKVGPKN